jgi:rubredoxin
MSQAQCRECGAIASRKNKDLIKEWVATPEPAPGRIFVIIHLWRCPKCGAKFRSATRVWPAKVEVRIEGIKET